MSHDAERAPAASTAGTTGTGRYLYAVTRGLDPSLLGDLTGLEGARLDVVRHEELIAVVSDVPLAEYGEEGLRRNLEKLEWLEPTVRLHDAVVKVVTSLAPTAPMRLATICFDDDGVRARLREWYFALQQVLDRIEGRVEWSVKAFAAAPSTEPVAVGTGGLSGADYLRHKQQERHTQGSRDAAAVAAAGDLHDALSASAAAVRLLPHQDPRLTGHTGTMVLNAAYLLPMADTESFAAAIDRLAARFPELEVEGHGPWAPYSFAMLDQR